MRKLRCACPQSMTSRCASNLTFLRFQSPELRNNGNSELSNQIDLDTGAYFRKDDLSEWVDPDSGFHIPKKVSFLSI